MREIKFRAWDLISKKMLIHGDEKLMAVIANKSIIGARELIVMQYTGLKDKNGKEIYEGDIVRSWSKNYEVKYEYGGYWPFAIAGFEIVEKPEECEVIGNIYENGDLLKEV